MYGFTHAQEFERIATAMARNQTVDSGPTPQDWSAKLHDGGKGPKAEAPPEGGEFGDVSKDVPAGFVFNTSAGECIASATFVAGWPNNNLRLQGTFLEVQRQIGAAAGTSSRSNNTNNSRRRSKDGDGPADADAHLEAATWQTIAVDGDVETRFHATAHSCGALSSCAYHDATVSWHIPRDAEKGTYRLAHYGTYYHKPALHSGERVEYSGTSGTFEVV